MTMESPAIPWHDRATVTVPEAAEILGVSRSTAYRAAETGTLPTVRIQTRIVVPTAVLERLLDPSAA